MYPGQALWSSLYPALRLPGEVAYFLQAGKEGRWGMLLFSSTSFVKSYVWVHWASWEMARFEAES